MNSIQATLRSTVHGQPHSYSFSPLLAFRWWACVHRLTPAIFTTGRPVLKPHTDREDNHFTVSLQIYTGPDERTYLANSFSCVPIGISHLILPIIICKRVRLLISCLLSCNMPWNILFVGETWPIYVDTELTLPAESVRSFTVAISIIYPHLMHVIHTCTPQTRLGAVYLRRIEWWRPICPWEMPSSSWVACISTARPHIDPSSATHGQQSSGTCCWLFLFLYFQPRALRFADHHALSLLRLWLLV